MLYTNWHFFTVTMFVPAKFKHSGVDAVEFFLTVAASPLQLGSAVRMWSTWSMAGHSKTQMLSSGWYLSSSCIWLVGRLHRLICWQAWIRPWVCHLSCCYAVDGLSLLPSPSQAAFAFQPLLLLRIMPRSRCLRTRGQRNVAETRSSQGKIRTASSESEICLAHTG